MADNNEIYKDRRDIQAQINEGLKDQNDLTTAFSKLLQVQLNTSEELTKSVKDRAKTLDTMIQSGNKNLSLDTRLEKLKSRQAEIDEKLSNSRDKAGRFQKGFNAQIVKSLNVDRENLDTQVKKLSIKKSINDSVKATTNALKSQIAKYLGITAIFAGLWKIATGFAAKIDDIGKTFGVMAADTAFVKNLTDAEFSAIGIGLGLEDVVSTVQTLSSEFGISTGEAASLSTTVLDTAKATGMSVDESTRLFGSLKSIVGLSNEQAEYLTESTFQLAKQKGVAPSAVMKDIAASSETIAEFTDSSGENIAEAAVQARQLGVSLDTTAKVAKGLLDFQSSLSAEIEASMLIGRDLNFQKARELALNNDISGAMNEVISQLGSEEEFNRMNVIQREALAKSIGVSTTELAKFVKGTKDLSVSGALASGEFENLVGQDAISGISRMMNKFKQFGAAVINALGPTFNKVAIIMSDWVGESGDLTEVLSEKFTVFGTKVEEFFEGIFKPAGEGTLSLWDSIGETMNKIPDFLKSMGNTIKWLIPIMITMKGISMSIALAEAAKMVFSMGAKSFGVGAVVGAGIAASVWGGIKALSSFNDLPSGQSASLIKGQAIFDPGESVVHTEDLKNMGVDSRMEARENKILEAVGREITALRKDMEGYFGMNGSTPNKIGSAVARNIKSNALNA